MQSHVAGAVVGDQLSVKGGNFRFRGSPVRGITMAAGTVKSEGRDFGMAVETADTGASYTIQIFTMTQSTGTLDIPGIVMNGGGFRSSPYSWVSQVCFMTAFTAIPSGYVDADVETRVTSRP
jgi:hypothetical protein